MSLVLAAWFAIGGQSALPAVRQLPDIVVTAPTAPDRVETKRFLRQIVPPSDFNAPMARFAVPVCVAVAGLPSPLPRQIADHMMRTAVQVGMAVADDGCRPNVLVIFTPDPAAQIRPLLKKRPALFDSLESAEIDRLSRTAEPSLAWSTVGTVSREGVEMAPGDDGVATQQQFFPSRLASPIRRDISMSIVLIDRSAAVGRSTDQLADYAVMRAFTGARPIEDIRSILSLFDVASPPIAATIQDIAFLRAFYRVPPDRRPGVQRGLIATELNRGVK